MLAAVDFDRVEPTNVTTLGYSLHELGQLKVASTAAAVAEIDASIAVESRQSIANRADVTTIDPRQRRRQAPITAAATKYGEIADSGTGVTL